MEYDKTPSTDDRGRTWYAYDAPEVPFVPLEQWGKDHYTTLLYAETRAVDYRGKLDNAHMRCDPRLHRDFANTNLGGQVIGGTSPTRLKEGELANHDDWSCLEDMAALGWVRIWWHQAYRMPVGGSVAKIELTEEGWRQAHALRRHMASGGRSGEFQSLV